MINVIITTIIIGIVFGFFFRNFDAPAVKETLSDRRRRKLQQIKIKN